MEKYAKSLLLSVILSGLLIVASGLELSAQIIVHLPLDRFLVNANRASPRFYRPLPMYPPGPRLMYMPRRYRLESDYRRDYYEDRRDAYYDERDDYEDRRDSYYERRNERGVDYEDRDYEDRRDAYYERPYEKRYEKREERRDDFEERRDTDEDRRDSYDNRNDREDGVYYDTRPRYDNYEENRNETLFKEYSAQGQFVRRIPKGAEKFKMAGKPFYMYEGIFYKPERKGYVIIPPPIGLRVKYVPRGARHLQIDRLDYYEINGTYYLDIPKKRYYEIVPEPVHETRKYPNQPQPKDYRRSKG